MINEGIQLFAQFSAECRVKLWRLVIFYGQAMAWPVRKVFAPKSQRHDLLTAQRTFEYVCAQFLPTQPKFAQIFECELVGGDAGELDGRVRGGGNRKPNVN
jgi:hypothetical protein